MNDINEKRKKIKAFYPPFGICIFLYGVKTPFFKWTTLKNISNDRSRLNSDKTYRNHLVFIYKVKAQMNVEWETLKNEMIKLNSDIVQKLKELN